MPRLRQELLECITQGVIGTCEQSEAEAERGERGDTERGDGERGDEAEGARWGSGWLACCVGVGGQPPPCPPHCERTSAKLGGGHTR